MNCSTPGLPVHHHLPEFTQTHIHRVSDASQYAAAAAKSLQSCPTLCDPMDCGLPGSSIHGILWARNMEWVAISFSNALKWKVKGKSLSHVWLLVTPWTAAHQAPLSMGFSRQEYWSGVPLPSPASQYRITLLFCFMVKLGWRKLFSHTCYVYGLPWWLSGKESICQGSRCRFNPWSEKIHWRRKWQPTAVFLPGESCGQRS